MTDSAVLLEDEFLAAAKELREITAQEKLLAERKEAVKALLAKVLAVGERGISPDGDILVTVRAGAARFNPQKAAEQLPTEVLPSVMVTTVDAKRAKAVLAPALYELCLDYNKPSVVAL